MVPRELLEMIVVGSVVGVILFVCLLCQGKWRKNFLMIAVTISVGSSLLFFVRPYYIDVQIERKVGQLEAYLEEHYPGEAWEIQTVPHRVNEHKHLNPYLIGVVFETEPDVTYHYLVKDKHTIVQSVYSSNTSGDIDK